MDGRRHFSVGDLVTALSDYREVVVSRLDRETYCIHVKTNNLARVVNIVRLVEDSFNLHFFMSCSSSSEFYSVDIHVDLDLPF